MPCFFCKNTLQDQLTARWLENGANLKMDFPQKTWGYSSNHYVGLPDNQAFHSEIGSLGAWTETGNLVWWRAHVRSRHMTVDVGEDRMKKYSYHDLFVIYTHVFSCCSNWWHGFFLSTIRGLQWRILMFPFHCHRHKGFFSHVRRLEENPLKGN